MASTSTNASHGAVFDGTFDGIIVRGGGDLASGVIFRLRQAWFRVIVLELETPLFVRRAVCYGDAIYEEMRTIEDVTAVRAADPLEAERLSRQDKVSVLIDPDGDAIRVLRPLVVVDARMEKHPRDTTLQDAPFVIALGPGFEVSVHCHAVVETNRGHHLGRVYWHGGAEPDTGEPGSIGDQTFSRVLRAPADGHVEPLADIGETIAAGQVIATVGGQPITAAFMGVLRGLIHPRVQVSAGMKVGDLDPRIERDHCFTISDKSLSVGGGVLEAILRRVDVTRLISG